MVLGVLVSGPSNPRPSIMPPESQNVPAVRQRGTFKAVSKVALPVGNTLVTVSTALATRPLRVAEIVAVCVVVWAKVVTANVPLVEPAGIVTLGETVAEEVRPLARVTTEPPAGAGPESSTVPVEELPPVTVLGARVTDRGVGDGATVRVVVLVVVAG